VQSTEYVYTRFYAFAYSDQSEQLFRSASEH